MTNKHFSFLLPLQSLCPVQEDSLLIPNVNHPRPFNLSTNYELMMTTNQLPPPPQPSTSNELNQQPSMPINRIVNVQVNPLTNSGHPTPPTASVEQESNSPEKSSDTSSGVHSNSSSETVIEKRSNSVEQLLQLMNGQTPRTGYKSMSLQRYVNGLPSNGLIRVNCIPSDDDADYDGVSTTVKANNPVYGGGEHMVIRRNHKPGGGMDVRGKMHQQQQQLDPFGRRTDMRLTSFTESPEYLKPGSMAMTFPFKNRGINGSEITTASQMVKHNEDVYGIRALMEPQYGPIPSRPVVTIAPQNISANISGHRSAGETTTASPCISMMYSHQRRDSTSYSIGSSDASSAKLQPN